MRLHIAAALAGSLAFSGHAWAAPKQAAAPNAPAAVPPDAMALFAHLGAASLRASRAAGHLISVDGPDYKAEAADLTVAAALGASDAIVRLAQAPDGRRHTLGLSEISIVYGPSPSASVANGVLTVTINAAMGPAGRPSSDQIIAAIND